MAVNLDQTQDYAALVAQFERDEQFANRLNFDINSPSRETERDPVQSQLRSQTVLSRASGSSTSARNASGPTQNIAQSTNTVIGRSWTVDTINLNDTVDEEALNTIYQDADSINSSQGAQFHSFGDDSPNSSVIQTTPSFANLEITRSEPTNIGRQPNFAVPSTSAINSQRSRTYQSEPVSANQANVGRLNTIDRRRSMRRTNQIENLTIRRRKSDRHKNKVISEIDDVLKNGELGFTLTKEGKNLLENCRKEIINLNKELEKSQKENERMVSEIESLEEAIQCPICYDNYVNLQPAVLPCNHVLCYDCGLQMNYCPACRTRFSRFDLRKIYLT